MINLQLYKIEDFVRARLDEVSHGNDAGFIDADTLNISRAIESCALTVMRNIHLAAPNVLLDGVVFAPKTIRTITQENEVCGIRFNLPDNFLRLVSVKVAQWDRPTQTLVAEDSVEYRKQKNKYLRGTRHNPVAAIVHAVNSGGAVGYAIELYPYSWLYDPPMSLQMLYVPELQMLGNGGTEFTICPKLEQACMYAITAEVARNFSMGDSAKMFDALAGQALDPTADGLRLYPVAGEKVINS